MFLVLCFGHVVLGEPAKPTKSRAIGESIRAGCEFLASTQSGDGTWNSWRHPLGETALSALALIAGGRPLDDPAVVAAADAVRRLAPTNTETYDVALAILLLDRLGGSNDIVLVRQSGQRLLAGQCRDGSWSYTLPLSFTEEKPAAFGAQGDNSNTQFGSLAAWVMRRHGIENDAALASLDRYYRDSFIDRDGGWSYTPKVGPASPTMTCAGLIGLATYRGAENQQLGGRNRGDEEVSGRVRQLRAEDDPIAKKALHALGRELLLADRDPQRSINTDLYFLWSLERVGVIYDVQEIGGVDWYKWGSGRLIKGQSRDGQWRGKGSKHTYDSHVGTSFAILFLSRANLAADLSSRIGSGAGVGIALPGLGGGTPLIQRPSAGGDVLPPLAPGRGSGAVGNGPKSMPSKSDPKSGDLDPFK